MCNIIVDSNSTRLELKVVDSDELTLFSVVKMPRRRRVSHSEPDAKKQGNTNVTPAIISLDSLERITTTPVHS